MREHRKRISDKLWDFGNQISDCDREILDCNTSINQLYNPLKATNYDGMPHGCEMGDTTLETVAMIENYHKEINCLVKQKDYIKLEFERYIEPLKHHVREIIRLRYEKGLKVHQIAVITSYSEDYTKQLIRQAMDRLR